MRWGLTIGIIVIVIIAVAITTVAVDIRQRGPEVSREAIDAKFVPAHTESFTYFSMIKIGDVFVSIPHQGSRHVEDEWKVNYVITYQNGSKRERWKSVSKIVYDQVRAALEEDGE